MIHIIRITNTPTTHDTIITTGGLIVVDGVGVDVVGAVGGTVVPKITHTPVIQFI
jgi:hypothetical protein